MPTSHVTRLPVPSWDEPTSAPEVKPSPDAADKAAAVAVGTAPPSPPPRPDREALATWPLQRDSYATTAFSDVVDRSLHAAVSRLTAGLSPAALTEAYLDWMHPPARPASRRSFSKRRCASPRGLDVTCRSACSLGPPPPLRSPASSHCRQTAASPARSGSSGRTRSSTRAFFASAVVAQRHDGRAWRDPQHERVVEFVSRQLLDMLSPANFIATNPEVLRKTVEEGGMNLVRG